jgi:hypothetical protein
VSMGGFRIVSFVYDELGIINSTWQMSKQH